MSRSFRKAWVVDGYGSSWKKYAKNQANRKVRKAKDLPNGSSYKKVFESWDICDYKYPADTKAGWFSNEPWKFARK